MGEIRIGSGVQAVTVLALLGAIGAAAAAQYPEIKRYLSIKQM